LLQWTPSKLSFLFCLLYQQRQKWKQWNFALQW